MPYRIAVDAEMCLSSGKCVADAPDVFRLDDDEVVEMLPGADSPSDDRQLQLARNCPSGAIRVFDGDDEIDPF